MGSIRFRTVGQHFDPLCAALLPMSAFGQEPVRRIVSVLAHLQSLAQSFSRRIAYVPVDISADLLRMSLDVSMRDIDDKVVEILPVELDIADPEAIESLKIVLDSLPSDDGTLIAMLGNTLANFRDDKQILRQVSSLLNPASDLLMLEMATAAETSQHSAQAAESEYEGSPSFRNFVFAALAQYTDCTPASGEVVSKARPTDGELKSRPTGIRDSWMCILSMGAGLSWSRAKRSGSIRRESTPAEALRSLLSSYETLAEADTIYSRAEGFGLTAVLLRAHH